MKKWYYFDENRWHGPVSDQELESLSLEGIIFENTPVVAKAQLAEDGDDPLTWDKVREQHLLKNNQVFKSNVRKLQQIEPDRHIDGDWSSNSALGAIILVTIVFVEFAVLYGFAVYYFPPLPALALDAQKVIFLLALALYAGFWYVYFSAGAKRGRLNVLTLRRLLLSTSLQWQPERADHFEDLCSVRHQLEEAYREKARVSIASIAIMIAASLLMLIQVNSIVLAEQNILQTPVEWRSLMLILAAISSFIAFISFLLSVDSLDSMFNKFKTDSIELVMVRRFYLFVVNPKYLGMIFMILSIVSIAAMPSGLIAAMLLCITLSVGYYHWFPSPDVVLELNQTGAEPSTANGDNSATKNTMQHRYLGFIYSSFAPGRVHLLARVPLFGILLPLLVYGLIQFWFFNHA